MRNGNFQVPRRSLPVAFVLTVPMRNGNCMQACIMGYMLKVLTVPMRNGNVQLQFDIVLELVGSYRTYEEWKLVSGNTFLNSSFVLTVPMRNGNSSKPPHQSIWKYVLTVPMRNGNMWSSLTAGRWMRVLTVPMRNGNAYNHPCFSKGCEFLPYL